VSIESGVPAGPYDIDPRCERLPAGSNSQYPLQIWDSRPAIEEGSVGPMSEWTDDEAQSDPVATAMEAVKMVVRAAGRGR
jgi:hypothetical protein